MKLRGNSYFLILIMAAMLAMVISSALIEYFESKLLPIVVGSAVFIMAGIELWKTRLLRGKDIETTTRTETSEEVETFGSWRGYLLAGSWVVCFFLAIYLVGLIIAIPLLIITYMRSHGIGWLATITFTVVTPVLVYGIFKLVLEVELYPGLLLTWLGG